MSDKNLKVSVILPTYNRGYIIDKCIQSVISQKYPNWELIISDDGSSDNTEEVCKGFNNERIKYFKNSKNLGLPANRNSAIDKSSGSLILFTEDDMVLDENCITTLLESYKSLTGKEIKVGGICPALATEHVEKGTKRDILNSARKSKEEELLKTPSIIDNRTGMIYRNFSPDYTDLMEVRDCHACSLYSAEMFKEVRYEEKAYKGSYTGEESDMHLRALKKGYHFYFQPKAIMYHNIEDQGGCRLPLYLWTYYFMRNHIMFLIRNFGKKSVYMIPSFFLFIASVLLGYYIGDNK